MTEGRSRFQGRGARLDAIERTLATHPEFGASDCIRAKMATEVRRRLGDVAEQLPAARDLASTLDAAPNTADGSVFGDTVVRWVINRARSSLIKAKRATDLAECEKVMNEVALVVREGAPWSQSSYGLPAQDGAGSGALPFRVWRAGVGDSILADTFSRLAAKEYGDPLCSPSAEQVRSLKESSVLLVQLLPLLSAGALGHVGIAAIFSPTGNWCGNASSSQYRLAGTIFLSPLLLDDRWRLAEHVLHESLHQKLYDLRYCQDLFRPLREVKHPALISPYWKQVEGERAAVWNVARALAAFHVYVHLTFFARRISESPQGATRGGPDLGVTSSETSLARAKFLGKEIERYCWAELGYSGRRLHGWLTAIVAELEL